MEFLNLSLFQLMAAAGALGAFVVALYFLDRRRRRVVVSSLRFWREAKLERHPLPQRRIQQPWSLLLQILALLALLAALADIRWTSNTLRSLDHVLVLDSSAWMQARVDGQVLMDRAKRDAVRWVRSLPPGDRVLLLVSDANPVPATTFEEDRAVLEAAIAEAVPGNTALQLGEALRFARQVLEAREDAGDIVFIGSRWIAEEEIPPVAQELTNLRVISADAEWRNVYFESITLQPRERDAGGWTAFVSVGNRGPTAEIPLQVSFGGAPVAATTVQVAPNSIATVPVNFRTGAAGWVDFRLDIGDMVRSDNFARVEVPRTSGVPVQVCTSSPARFAALFRAHPGWVPTYESRSPCPVSEAAELVVLDGRLPSGPLTRPALWIEPPDGSPFSTRQANVARTPLQWNPSSPISDGLQAKDLQIGSNRALQLQDGDKVVAEADGAAVATARPGNPPQVAWSFQPLASEMRFEVATPLLFANAFRWLNENSALPEELSIGSAGLVLLAGLDLDDEVAPLVLDGRGNPMPVSKSIDGWRFFAGTAGVYQVRQGHRERIVSLTLPQSPKAFWEPSEEQMMAGIPGSSSIEPPTRWWVWLAIFGLLCLVADALLFDKRQRDPEQRNWGQTADWNPLRRLLGSLRQRARREAKSSHGV
jgi:hypothetical protein